MLVVSGPTQGGEQCTSTSTCMGVAPKEKDSKLAPSTAVGEEARRSGSISALSSAPSARSKAGHRTCSASLRNLHVQPDGRQRLPSLCQHLRITGSAPRRLTNCAICDRRSSVVSWWPGRLVPSAASVKACRCGFPRNAALFRIRLLQGARGSSCRVRAARTWRAHTRCA